MKIKGGYILQPRKFNNSEASKMPPVTRELWFYILRKVNHKTNDKFKKGQNFFNLGDIQNDLSWYAGYRKMMYSKPQLTKSLRRLRESNMVETTKATRGLIITVCNWEFYQDPKNYEGNDDGQTKETRRKWSGHTKNKNDKNVKNDKNNNKWLKFKPDWITENDFNDLLSHKKKKKGEVTERTIKSTIKELEKSKTAGLNITECVDEYLNTTWAAYKHDWILNRLTQNGNKNGKNTGFIEPGEDKDYRS